MRASVLSDWLAQRLVRGGEQPIYRQLHRLLQQAILSRELPAGEVYSPAFLAAVDHALQLRIPDRPESVAAFAAELGLRDFDRTGSGYG
ncbi:hypothetical protein DD788_32010, partial [Ralstonia pickettii]|nr:hypothetical protein [Ralstonia pickettii]